VSLNKLKIQVLVNHGADENIQRNAPQEIGTVMTMKDREAAAEASVNVVTPILDMPAFKRNWIPYQQRSV
jgi:hypothetical protein